MDELCWNCRSFNYPGQGDSGECRRNSPRVKFSRRDDEIGSVWPVVAAEDWCGEFRPTRARETAPA